MLQYPPLGSGNPPRHAAACSARSRSAGGATSFPGRGSPGGMASHLVVAGQATFAGPHRRASGGSASEARRLILDIGRSTARDTCDNARGDRGTALGYECQPGAAGTASMHLRSLEGRCATLTLFSRRHQTIVWRSPYCLRQFAEAPDNWRPPIRVRGAVAEGPRLRNDRPSRVVDAITAPRAARRHKTPVTGDRPSAIQQAGGASGGVLADRTRPLVSH